MNICNSAGHKVRQRQTGNSAGYRDRAGGESVSRTIRFEAHHAAPEGHLMFASHDAEVITERNDGGTESGRRCDQPAGYEPAKHIDTCYAGHVLVNVHSNIGRAKPGRHDFSVRCSIPGGSKRIDHVRAEQVRVAVRE